MTVTPVASIDQVELFPNLFDAAVALAARAMTVHGARASVEVGDRVMTARFGPWMLTTPLIAVTCASASVSRCPASSPPVRDRPG